MHTVRRPVAPVVLSIGAYIVLAVVAYWPVMPLDASKLPVGGVGDPQQMSWFLAWTPFAILHGHSPFFTNFIDYPSGANLAANTSVPLLGILASPVTLSLGPIASFNLLLRIALAGSATSMFLVARRWTSWWPAAFGAGLLYGFGSYMSFEGSIHLDLAFMVIPPLLVWCLDELFVTRRRSPLKVGILLGLLSAAQLLIDPEVLVFCALLAAIGLVVLALANRDEVVARARSAAPGVLSGLFCFVALSAYQIAYYLAGPRHISGGILSARYIATYHVDLLRPVLLSVPRVIAPGVRVTSGRAAREISGYLGAPLLALLVVLAVWWRRLGIIRFAVVCACVTFVLSLGPRLTIYGHTYPIWLPAAIFEHVPVLVNLEPVRLTGVGTIFLAIILAVGLDRTRAWAIERASGRSEASGLRDEAVKAPRLRGSAVPTWQTVALLAVTAAAFVPPLQQLLPIVRERPMTAPRMTTSLARHVPDGGVVLAFPYPRGRNDAPMLWQAVDEMSFRIVGGYALVPNSRGEGRYYPLPGPDLGKLASILSEPATTPAPSLRDACGFLDGVLRAYDVDALVLRTRSGAIRARGVALLTRLLGRPSATFFAGSVWYHLRQRRSTPACPATAPGP